MRALAIVVSLALVLTAAAGDAIPWLDRPSDALERARSDNRPVMVDLWAVWCAPCLLMDQTTYRHPDVVEAVGTFVPLKIDVDAQGAFADRYEVEGYPTVLFLDGQGRELSRLTGLVEPADMIRRLEQIREGYSAYLDAADRGDDPDALRRAALYLMEIGNADAASIRLKRARRLLDDGDPAARDEIELALARALWLDGREGAAARRYRKLAEKAANADLRARARTALEELESD